MIDHGCCAPSASRDSVSIDPGPAPLRGRADTDGMVLLDGGEFLMGSEDRFAYPGDGEGPVRRVRLDSFWVDTLRRLECAVRAVRRRDRLCDGGRALRMVLRLRRPPAGRLPAYPRCCAGSVVAAGRGCRLASPGGPAFRPRRARSTIRSFTSRGTTLRRSAPGPASACRPRPNGSTRRAAGSRARAFPWGDELEPEGEHRMNVWQGTFPSENSCADGFYGTCPGRRVPVERIRPPQHDGQRVGVVRRLVQPGFPHARAPHEPRGPAPGHAPDVARRLLPLPHSYCLRYRVAARNALTPDTSTGNVGFRCVRSATDPTSATSS